MTESKIKVWLYDLDGPALIVPASTGVVYLNQTNGLNCCEDQLEGYLIPLDGEALSSVYPFNFNHFMEEMFPESNIGYIDEQMGKRIEQFLANSLPLLGIKIDWTKFDQSHEAWLYVVANDTEYTLHKGLCDQVAVLTWPNSD